MLANSSFQAVMGLGTTASRFSTIGGMFQSGLQKSDRKFSKALRDYVLPLKFIVFHLQRKVIFGCFLAWPGLNVRRLTSEIPSNCYVVDADKFFCFRSIEVGLDATSRGGIRRNHKGN